MLLFRQMPQEDCSYLKLFFVVVECIRAPPRRGRYWEIHPWRPKDFPRPERFPEGEARGKSRGSREIWRAEGMDFPIPPEFWWSTDNLSASIFLQGVDQKILPCGQGRIASVKINPSPLMMKEWSLHLFRNLPTWRKLSMFSWQPSLSSAGNDSCKLWSRK